MSKSQGMDVTVMLGAETVAINPTAFVLLAALVIGAISMVCCVLVSVCINAEKDQEGSGTVW